MHGLLQILKYSIIFYSYGFSLIYLYLFWKELSENCLNYLNNLSFKYLTNICFNKKKEKKMMKMKMMNYYVLFVKKKEEKYTFYKV